MMCQFCVCVCALLAHCLHDGRLCVGHQHKRISIQAVFADPLVQVGVHVNTRTGDGAGGAAGGGAGVGQGWGRDKAKKAVHIM